MESVYTAQQVFSTISGKRVVSVKANGGSVVVACKHGADWITFKTFTADGAEVVDFVDGRDYRFTPAGGATYAL